MPQRAFFVTGTDTGIGKTTVTCAIAAALSRRGVRVGVAKPFETGCEADADGHLIAVDARTLKYFANCDESLDAICPVRCREPLAPAIALRREERTVNLDQVKAAALGIAERHDVTFIEGAGGLLVPIASTMTFADLARDWGLPILIVVGNRLGALNHAQLTLRVAHHAGLDVAGYIVNTVTPGSDIAMQTNIEALLELIGPSLGVLPYLGTIEHTQAERERLSAAAEAGIALSGLPRYTRSP